MTRGRFSAGAGARSAFRSLSIRNYRIWFAGAFISNIGLWMSRIGQDWVVLTQLTHESGFAVGVTTGLQFLPQLLLAPVAGMIADRFPKRKLLLATQISMAVLQLLQAVLVLGGFATLVHMYLFAFAMGVVGAIDAPPRQIFVSEIVGPSDVANAVGLNSVSFNGARLIGPAAGGLLIQAVGAGWAFAVNGLTYLAMIGALLFMDRAQLRAVRRVSTDRVGFRSAFAFLRRTPHVLVVVLVITLVSTIALNFQVTIALMAVVVFHRQAGDYGLLSSAMAVGALGGGLLSARVRTPRFRTVVSSAFGLGIAMVVAAVSPGYVVFAICLVFCGLCMLRLVTTANAYVQLSTPDTLRGRVMSIYLAGFLGGAPIGSPLIGWIGQQFSPQAALLAGAASCAVAVGGVVLWLLFTGRVLAREVPGLALHPHRPDRFSGIAHPETGPLVLPDLETLREESRGQQPGTGAESHDRSDETDGGGAQTRSNT